MCLAAQCWQTKRGPLSLINQVVPSQIIALTLEEILSEGNLGFRVSSQLALEAKRMTSRHLTLSQLQVGNKITEREDRCDGAAQM